MPSKRQTRSSRVTNHSGKLECALAPGRQTQLPPPNAAQKSTRSNARGKTKVGCPRPGSKAAKMLALLKRQKGVTINDLVRATGWQPHSVRGFLSGVVVRKMGLKIRSAKSESGERHYALMS